MKKLTAKQENDIKHLISYSDTPITREQAIAYLVSEEWQIHDAWVSFKGDQQRDEEKSC